MGRLKYIFLLTVLFVVTLAGCNKQKVVTTQRRASITSARLAAATGGVAYGGRLAVYGEGRWITDPNDAYPTTWRGAFADGKAQLSLQNAHNYTVNNRYIFCLVGDNSGSVDCVGDKVAMLGGEVDDNDVIWASDTVTVTASSDNQFEVAAPFRHLFAQVRFELTVRGQAATEADGDFALSDISALGYLTDGEADVLTGVVSPTDDGRKLSTARFATRYFVMPHTASYTQPSTAVIKVQVDGKTFDVTLNDTIDSQTGYLRLNANRCRVFRLNYDGFSVTDVVMPQWNTGEDISVGGVALPPWTHD